MTRPYIKICGINQIATAIELARMQVNFAGLIFYPSSSKHCTLEQAIDISHAVRHTSLQLVAVFVEQTAAEMKFICEETKIQIVQLHGQRAHAEANNLPAHLQKILLLEPKLSLSAFDPARDYLILDKSHTITGRAYDWNNCKLTFKNFRCFLAGGLTSHTVARYVQAYHPYGVDVSSGVENAKHIKSLSKIKQFIHQTQVPL